MKLYELEFLVGLSMIKYKATKTILCVIFVICIAFACASCGDNIEEDNYTSADSSQNSGTDYSDNSDISEVTQIDNTAPVITVSDFTIVQGGTVSYKSQAIVIDDFDPSPVLTVDSSAVDIDTLGVYPVTYTCTDSSGNVSTVTVNATVVELTRETVTEDIVLKQAEEVLSEITDDSMSDMEKAFIIYNWSRDNIRYVGTSDKSDWIVGAYDAFNTLKGDCFTYFACAKALLTAAGIDNLDVMKLRTSEEATNHYWSLINLGDGWYHFDSTPFRYSGDNFFMVTSEELWAWDDKYYEGEHIYITDGLPEVATESVQHLIDYKNKTVKE